ncbi:serine/threonine protein kinase [Aphanothece sacrum FPU1]|uniref:Serine/threonine protein kinase n=1 Tax=Aphanothece sacrum FPU1 TaxID=1920663 RepID=A0A401ICN5_APHSA|nr:serine/threonine protein kinase [Aphanothece sacrum FPU1]GBF84450.1 serine/threonine protein kinase [Aphanothece sacrum FPU3]
MIGGHPYLVKLLCQELAQKIDNTDEILNKASTESGLYSEFLRQQIHLLKQQSDLD